MNLFNLIRASNPTKVKIGSRPRAAHEVPLLTVTANRVIEMEDPTAATDSSGSTGAEDQETTAPEVPPPENVPTKGGALEAGPAERVAATDPPAVKEHRKRCHDRVDTNAPPKELDLWECFCEYVRLLIFSTYEFDFFIADLLSTLIVTFSSSECVSLLSSLFNHNACADAAMNSDSHDDSATVACFYVLQLIAMASNNQIVSILATGANTSSKSMPCSSHDPCVLEVRDPIDPWACKEEILLADAIAANVSHAEKKKKCRVGLAILLTDAATQTETSDEASPQLLSVLCAPWESLRILNVLEYDIKDAESAAAKVATRGGNSCQVRVGGFGLTGWRVRKLQPEPDLFK
nr:hypothetical protein [Tanacetum cinerariifolium]